MLAEKELLAAAWNFAIRFLVESNLLFCRNPPPERSI